MKFNDILEAYMEDNIDESILYNNIRQCFRELLDEYKFRKLEYLKIYPFISELQDEDLYESCTLKNKIKDIKDILGGKKTFSYDLWMRLEECDMSNIRGVWDEYIEKGKILFEEHELLEKKKSETVTNIRTVQDICWEKLLNLLIGLPTLDDDCYMYNLLYSNNIDKSTICKEIERLIDILEGKRPVHMSMIYTNKDVIYTI